VLFEKVLVLTFPEYGSADEMLNAMEGFMTSGSTSRPSFEATKKRCDHVMWSEMGGRAGGRGGGLCYEKNDIDIR
jgi:hypothetical protein